MAMMGIREYARYRGCSHSAVSKAARQGRISLIDGKVDQECADRDWADNTHRAKPVPEQPQKLLFGDKPAAKAAAKASPAPTTYSQARSRREQIAAEREELKLRQEKGELIEAAGVHDKYFELARGLRNQLLQIPTRIAAQLAACTQEHAVLTLLKSEIEETLRRISNDLEKRAAAGVEESPQSAPKATQNKANGNGVPIPPPPAIAPHGGEVYAQ